MQTCGKACRDIQPHWNSWCIHMLHTTKYLHMACFKKDGFLMILYAHLNCKDLTINVDTFQMLMDNPILLKHIQILS